MSNILTDVFRQEIALEAINKTKPACYVDVGCHEGASMNWWAQHIPVQFGCDINPKSLETCRQHVPGCHVDLADSRVWLQQIELPEPIIFYLDTDWVADLAKYKEMEIILHRWPTAVMVINSVNQPGHPLYKVVNRPWDVFEMFDMFGHRVQQYIYPKYKHPELTNGYVVLNGSPHVMEFNRNIFADLLEEV